jgi:ribosomal protein S15P/S13E
MTDTKKSKWTKLKPEDIVKKVVELGKTGTPPEKIGLILRDKHGIPKAKIFGKKVTQILKESGIESNSEHNNIIKKSDTLKKHLEKNKHDYSAKKSLIKSTGRLNKFKRQLSKSASP